MRRYFDADKLKEIVDRQYKYCHGYTGTKKDIYREALLAIKSAIHCQSVSKDMQEVIRCKGCSTSLLLCGYGLNISKGRRGVHNIKPANNIGDVDHRA